MSNVFSSLLLAVSLCLAAGAANAQRSPVPVINYENQVWTRADSKALTSEQVKQGIVKAIQEHKAEGSYPWQLDSAADGKVGASVHVRGKHTVRVLVTFTQDKFSVNYLSSDNMKEGKDESGKEIIHPFYNRWAGDLTKAIRDQLARM